LKKLLATTLVCITIISTLGIAEASAKETIGMFQTKPVSSAVLSEIPIPEKPPSAIIPGPEPIMPIDYRGYTGFKIFYDKELKDGKVTMQAYHIKRGNKDFFMYTVQYCVYNDMGGLCSAFSSNRWIEGKVAGKNWIIRDGDFSATLGQKIGNINSGSWHALLKIE